MNLQRNCSAGSTQIALVGGFAEAYPGRKQQPFTTITHPRPVDVKKENPLEFSYFEAILDDLKDRVNSHSPTMPNDCAG
jgi:hypothetical protein